MGYGCGDLSRISPAFLAKLERSQSVKVKLTNGQAVSWLFTEFGKPLPNKELQSTITVVYQPFLRNGKLHYTGDIYTISGDLLLRGVYVDRFKLVPEASKTFKDYL